MTCSPDDTVAARATAQTIRCACDTRSVLGEAPLWVARENAVYWVDIKGRLLHRLALADGAYKSWPMPDLLGWVVARRDQPGFMAGFRGGFARLQLDPVRVEFLGLLEKDLPCNRLNDAGVDRTGCIWAGTMDDREENETGALYRLDCAGSWTRRDTGYIVSNGPTFSPAHDVLYHTDTTRRVVYRFPLAPDGSLGEREVFVAFADGWGSPDGMATDSQGGVWIAHWGGARLSRFLPDGSLDRVVEMPVSRVTNCCFAGPALERMFVTSAAIGAEDESLSGCLFEVAPGVRGAPTYAYCG